MPTLLGKRKRRASLNDSASPEPTDTASSEHLQALFRKHFEAKYKPLPPLEVARGPTASVASDACDSEESEWEGLDNGDGPGESVPVVEHITRPKMGGDEVSKAEGKMFMVGPADALLLPIR